MPNVSVVNNFPSDAQGFSDAGLTGNIAFAWNGSDGSPANGCVGFTSTTVSMSGTIEQAKTSNLKTWEDYGVPPGAVVQTVQLYYSYKTVLSNVNNFKLKQRITSVGTSVTSPVDIDYIDASPAPSWLALNTTLTSVSMAYQASSTPVQFVLECWMSTGSGAASCDVRIDSITYIITYTGGSGGGGGHVAERATVYEGAQFAVQSTLGTSVAANRRLLGLEWDFDPKADIKEFRPMGSKVNTTTTRGKEYTEGKLNGVLAYNDAVYLFSSLLCNTATVAKPANTYLLTLGVQASGTFTLTWNSLTTAVIVYNPTAAIIGAALELLTGIGPGNVFVQPTAVVNQFQIYFCHLLGTTALALTGTFASMGTPGNASLVATVSTNARRWFFNPLYNQPDTNTAFTCEKGAFNVATFGQQIPYNVISSANFKFNKDGALFDAASLGQALVEAFSLTTASITELACIPVDPATVSVYVGPSTAAMTRLTRCLEAEVSVADRFDPIMTLDDSFTSFSQVIEKPAMPTTKLVVEHIAESQTILAAMRASTTQFMKFEMKGAAMETGFPYRISITMPVRIKDTNRAEKDSIESREYPGTVIYDPGFAGFLKVEVDNLLTAL